eukprot:6181589-Pleurochrysis_carterae.AAC.1
MHLHGSVPSCNFSRDSFAPRLLNGSRLPSPAQDAHGRRTLPKCARRQNLYQDRRQDKLCFDGGGVAHLLEERLAVVEHVAGLVLEHLGAQLDRAIAYVNLDHDAPDVLAHAEHRRDVRHKRAAHLREPRS